MVEVRQLAKRLSARSPVKLGENVSRSHEAPNRLKSLLGDSNENGRDAGSGKDQEDGRTSTTSRRGKVQEARMRAKIAALASRKALNGTKNVRGDPATSDSRDVERPASETATEDETTFIVETERVSDASLLTTPMMNAGNTRASTPGMTNLSQFLFSSNSKSTNSEIGEQLTVQKPEATSRIQQKGSDNCELEKSPASAAPMSETHDRLMGEVDYVFVRQELLQLNRKFTGYWMRTSEGCSEMTDLIQNVKDDSQQIHAALANELEQVTDRMASTSSKIEQVEHKVDGLEVKFDAMNNVLSTNLKALCSIAMSKEESEKETSAEQKNVTENVEEAPISTIANDERYDELTKSVEEKISGLESKISSAVESLSEESDSKLEKKLDARFVDIRGAVEKCMDATSSLSNATVSKEELQDLSRSVDQKVGSLETRLSSHLTKALENLEYFKEHSLGSHLSSKMTELREDMMEQVSRVKSEQSVSSEQVSKLTQLMDEKVCNLEERLVREIQQNTKLAEQNEKVLESELDTKFSECKKEVMRSTVKSEQLLTLQHTVDQNIKNLEQRLKEQFATAINESQGTVHRALDEKWEGLKKDLMSSASAAPDEYLDIMHKMSEKIKHLDSKYQEVLLTSENNLEWIQEKQSGFMNQVKTDIESKLTAIESKASELQSNEAVAECIKEALYPMDAKVDEAVKQVAKLETETSQKIEAAVAKAADVEERFDALKADCEELGKKMELQESEKDGAAHDEELKKIQNAQRDLYCGLYCTSKVLKEKILSVENKLEDLSRSGLSSSGRHDETYGEQPHQVETDLDDLQKKVQQLQVSVESSAEEMRSEFSSSIHQMKEHAAAEVEMLSATFRDNLSKIAQDNEESEEKKAREMELIEEKFEQLTRHFEKRLLEHKRSTEQKLKDIVGEIGMSTTPVKRGSTRFGKTTKRATKANQDEDELQRKCLEAIMKQIKVQGNRLAELEALQVEAARNHPRLETNLDDDMANLLSHRDSKKQTKEVIKVLTQHVGAVEGKMGLFEETIHQLTQSVAVAHAKLADQDNVGQSKASKGSKGAKPKVGSSFSVTVKTASPAGKVARGSSDGARSRIRASPIHPRVTHNKRKTPEKTRPLAFY